MSFHNKVVIVTGSSSGIGAVTAKYFAKESASVVIVGRNEAKLAQVTAEISKLGNKPLTLQADLSKENDAKRIIDETISKFGKIDVLVNNAALAKSGTLLDGKVLESYDAVMATNLRAVVHLTSLAAPHLIKTKGNIVNISSTCATMVMAGPDLLMYSVSKAALNHFSRGAALELSSHGVRVNIVSPGPVNTDIAVASGLHFDVKDLAKTTALKRISEPEEIADVILFLASDKAKGITGSDFVADSGIRLGPSPNVPATQ